MIDASSARIALDPLAMIVVKVVRYSLLISFYMLTGRTKQLIAPNTAFGARLVDFYTLISVILNRPELFIRDSPRLALSS
jgi:hypothetical protein